MLVEVMRQGSMLVGVVRQGSMLVGVVRQAACWGRSCSVTSPCYNLYIAREELHSLVGPQHRGSSLLAYEWRPKETGIGPLGGASVTSCFSDILVFCCFQWPEPPHLGERD